MQKFRVVQLGFTLLEILIVIAIIGVLASLATLYYRTSLENADIAKAQSDIDTIHGAIGQLMVDTGYWPGLQNPETVTGGSANEIWDLSVDAAGLLGTDGSYPNWRGPYTQVMPTDPWGNDYFLDTDYELDDGRIVPVVGSFGPNGVGPNVYDSDDIIKVIY